MIEDSLARGAREAERRFNAESSAWRQHERDAERRRSLADEGFDPGQPRHMTHLRCRWPGCIIGRPRDPLAA